MALEDYILERIVKEAAPILIGEKAGRIFESVPLEFAINLRKSTSLYCSVIPSRPGLFLTSRSIKSLEGERTAGHFTNLLRKYVSNATISKIIKERGERRILAGFDGYSASGEPLEINLLIELTGRSANAHLFVSTSYLASLREIPESSQQPSLTIQPLRDGELKLSPTLARELAAREMKAPASDALGSLLSELNDGKGAPRIYAPSELKRVGPGEIDPRRNLILTYIDLVTASDLTENRFDTINEAADNYFALLKRVEAFKSRQNSLAAKLKAEAARLETLLKRLGDEKTE